MRAQTDTWGFLGLQMERAGTPSFTHLWWERENPHETEKRAAEQSELYSLQIPRATFECNPALSAQDDSGDCWGGLLPLLSGCLWNLSVPLSLHRSMNLPLFYD